MDNRIGSIVGSNSYYGNTFVQPVQNALPHMDASFTHFVHPLGRGGWRPTGAKAGAWRKQYEYT